MPTSFIAIAEIVGAGLEKLLGETVVKLVASSERPDMNYDVIILNSPSVNAFALPGGPMFLNRGMIEAAKSEGEVAGVIALLLGGLAATVKSLPCSKPVAGKLNTARTTPLPKLLMVPVPVRTAAEILGYTITRVRLALVVPAIKPEPL